MNLLFDLLLVHDSAPSEEYGSFPIVILSVEGAHPAVVKLARMERPFTRGLLR
jgi:hypothetical protein